jgi:hypothetical protein
MARFFAHARRQMAARGISEQDVEQVLANYDSTYPSRSGRQTYVRELADGRRIAVIVEPYDHELVVTTFDQLHQS